MRETDWTKPTIWINELPRKKLIHEQLTAHNSSGRAGFEPTIQLLVYTFKAQKAFEIQVH